MKTTLRFRLAWFLCLGVLLIPFLPTTSAHGQADELSGRTITGTIYYMGGRRTGQSRPFHLIIKRLSTAEEVQRLNSSIQSGGQDELLKVLSKMDAGRIQLGPGVGVTANAIIATPQNGGTKLIVLYQRYLRFSELRFGTRSEDYKFGYAELFLGGKSNTGMLIPAAKIRLKEGNAWEVEDFGTFPARLMGLEVRGKKRPNVS